METFAILKDAAELLLYPMAAGLVYLVQAFWRIEREMSALRLQVAQHYVSKEELPTLVRGIRSARAA